nr:immunoglobulin heavy chain junction region [Macaca mulatta]
CVRKNSNLDFW